MAGTQSAKDGACDMTVDERIIKALSALAPVERDELGDWKVPGYLFHYDTVPMALSNNAPKYERVLIQIHLYCPADFNCLVLRQRTKQAIFGADFTWPEEISVGLEKEAPGDVVLQHYVYECECTQRVSLHG